MEISSLYNTAKNFAETLKGKRPELTQYDACLCLIIADSGDIFSGVSTISINEGAVEDVPAERIAVMSVITAKHIIAKQMIVISLDDYSYFKPEDEALSLLVNSSVDNSSCKVVLSPEEEVAAATLAPESAAPDFLSGYDELAAPADFASGISVDESNPFNAEDNKQEGAPNSLYEHPEEAQQQGASGFPNLVGQQQGYPQPGGFPQQQGYPQQGGFPQQQGSRAASHSSRATHSRAASHSSRATHSRAVSRSSRASHSSRAILSLIRMAATLCPDQCISRA